MASGDVEISIRAQDGVTATLRKIQAELTQFGSSVKSFQSRAGAAFGAVIGSQALQVGFNLARDSLKEFAHAEQAQIRLQSVLRATGNTTRLQQQEIIDFANRLQGSTGTEAEAILDAAAQLARFREIGGDTFKEVLSLANDMSKVLGTDVTSSATQLAKALNSPAEGLSRLARSGVMFSEAQKEIIKGLDETGRRAEAQQKILEEVRRQFGGAGEAYGKSVAGNIDQLNHAIGDLKEAIGEALVPALKEATQIIRGLRGSDAKAEKLNLTTGLSPNGAIAQAESEFQRVARAQQKAIDDMRANTAAGNFVGGRDMRLFGFDVFGYAAENERLKRVIAENERILGQALQRVKPAAEVEQSRAVGSALQRAIGDVGGRLFRGFDFTAQFQGANIAGIQLPSNAEIQGKLLANALFGAWSPWSQQAEAAEQVRRDTQTPGLSATESRFLTRGRGNLDPAVRAANEQVAILRRIEKLLSQDGEAVLGVEVIG